MSEKTKALQKMIARMQAGKKTRRRKNNTVALQ
jgi:hypothetical protein